MKTRPMDHEANTQTDSHAPSDSVISTRGLVKRFGVAEKSTIALDDINLDVEEGEFLVILGPSGSGKTTLLRIIAGLTEPTEGEILLSKSLVTGQKGSALGHALGFVFQQPNLLPWRSVFKNIELPLEVQKVSKAVRKATSKTLAKLVGLENFGDAFPRQLSGGMAQRVAIARALSFDPAVLLMDEPFGALDAQTRDDMGLELQRVWMESKKTVIFVTHSIPEAVFLADRIVMLSAHPGRVASITNIDFPRPRKMDLLADAEFSRTVGVLREELEPKEND